MKKIKFLFLGFVFVTFFASNYANAQALIRVPGTVALTIAIENNAKIGHIVVYDEGRIVLTPSGNLQLKASVDLNSYANLVEIPTKGKKKITVARVAVRVLPKGDPAPTYHFEAYDVDVIVDSQGMASVVVNWQVDEMMSD